MSHWGFHAMNWTFKVVDVVFPYIDRRVKGFGIEEGETLVDYGCGPGRYTIRFARLVGLSGMVYAVDIHPMAIHAVEQKIEKLGLENVTPVLAQGYNSTLPGDVADIVCAIDMFFAIKEPDAFLREIHRITKPQGHLIIDDGHQTREETKRKLHDAGTWIIAKESRDHLVCYPYVPDV